MNQTIAPPLTLYDRDLDLWLETAIAQLKAGDFHNLDVENLIDELLYGIKLSDIMKAAAS